MSSAATARLGGWPSLPTGDDPADGEPIQPRGALAPGAWIAGRYRVERVLAQGGMGVVVEAVHALLDKRVAVKLLRQEVAGDEDALRRFLNEARIAAQLPGDHIARAIDFGRTEDGETYLVMELLVGRDLEAELRARGSLPVAEAVDYMLQACEGVAEAHAVGLVHRDLKPANLFLTRRRDGSALVKVLDFGISKWSLGAAASTVTTRTTACGTPAYMAPEQLEGITPVDTRCDQHALAAVLFELIAGQRPYTATTLYALSLQITSRPPPRLGNLVPGVPPGLEAAITRALAKQPADRFADLASFARAIAPFGGPGAAASARSVARVLECPPSSRRSSVEITVPPGEATTELAPGGRAMRTMRTMRDLARPAARALLASAVLLCGIGSIGMALDPGGPPAGRAERGVVRAAGSVGARPDVAPAPPDAPEPEAPAAQAATAVTRAGAPMQGRQRRSDPAAAAPRPAPRAPAPMVTSRAPETKAPAAVERSGVPKGVPKGAPNGAPKSRSAREVFDAR